MVTAWTALFVVAAAGAAGGLVTALLPRGARRRKMQLDDPEGPEQPGLVASIVVGSFAAVAGWGLGAEDSARYLVGGAPTGGSWGLTVGQLVAAMATGLVGFKWLANHWSSKMNNFVAQKLAGAPPDEAIRVALADDRPGEALRRIEELNRAQR